jgi:ATP-dependent Clp protease adaptor protein ClpS
MSSSVITKPKVEVQAVKAMPWTVTFHNDDRTTFDCVVEILVSIIGKSYNEACQLTLRIHNDGAAVVARETQEIAETFKTEAISYARQHGYPLKITIERDD